MGVRVACRTAEATGAVGGPLPRFPGAPTRPDRKKEKSRLAELDAVTVPTLVVQGARDPFGMPLPQSSAPWSRSRATTASAPISGRLPTPSGPGFGASSDDARLDRARPRSADRPSSAPGGASSRRRPAGRRDSGGAARRAPGSARPRRGLELAIHTARRARGGRPHSRSCLRPRARPSALASGAGMSFRPLRGVDSLAGFVLGPAMGLVLVWVAGAVALQLPGQTRLREEAQRSEVLQRLNEIAPPSRALRALARVDAFPAIAGPLAPVDPPDPGVLRSPGCAGRGPQRGARPRDRVRSLGLGLRLGGRARARRHERARRGRRGRHDGRRSRGGAPGRRRGRIRREERCRDPAGARPRAPAHCAWSSPTAGIRWRFSATPENGPFAASPGRIGPTGTVVTDDALGRGRVRAGSRAFAAACARATPAARR